MQLHDLRISYGKSVKLSIVVFGTTCMRNLYDLLCNACASETRISYKLQRIIPLEPNFSVTSTLRQGEERFWNSKR